MRAAKPGDDSRPAEPCPPSTVLGSYEAGLKSRVLDELALVQGRVALATHLDPIAAKEQLRFAHSSQRDTRMQESHDWLLGREDALLENFADGQDIDPALIDPVVIPVRTPLDADLFRYATLQWSVPVSSGYGRRSRFLVRDRQNGKLIAIFALGDPVIAQSSRDAAIGWNTQQRNARLYNVLDAFILGAVEPYRQLLAGKLAALLTMSNETRDFLFHKYNGTKTGIRGESKDPTPVLITTSSALGRSSVYNRVTFEKSLMFHSVGYTKGFGHFQFSDELFGELMSFVREDVLSDPKAKAAANNYGSGPNWRFRVIRTALKALEIPEESLQHNIKREVFLAPTATGWDSYLRGETDTFESFDMPTAKIGAYYRERWAIGRAERRPAFKLWRAEESRILPKQSPSHSRPSGLAVGKAGRVDMGAYSLAIGIGVEKVHGKAPSGTKSSGSAYLSRLEGKDLAITLADISWDTGEREVRGWNRHDSSPVYDDVIGRLSIPVEKAARYRTQSVMDLKMAAVKTGARANVYKTTAPHLSALLGFDLPNSLDRLSEGMVGTRESLLRDDTAHKSQLCVVFESGDRALPAVAWALTRPLSLLLTDPTAGRPTAPTTQKAPPKIEEFDESQTSPGDD